MLKILGLWEWGVYVAQHLPDKKCREMCTQEILNRCLSTRNENSERLNFVRAEIGVPEIMISTSCALLAKYEVIDVL